MMTKSTKAQPPAYSDDPEAVSLHTTPENVRYSSSSSTGDDITTRDLPGNSGSSSSSPPSYEELSHHYVDPDEGKFIYKGLNDHDSHFAKYTSSQHIFQQKNKLRVHISGEHVPIQHPPSDNDPDYLLQWVEYMSRQAPSAYVMVSGTHTERRHDSDGKRKRNEVVVDFRILVSMRNYLWPSFRRDDPAMMELRTVENGEKTWRGTVFKRRAPGVRSGLEVGDPKPTLKEWCHRYCASAASTRIFCLTRTVVGFDEEYLRNRLTGIIRATDYRGNLHVAFPVADRAVDIYSKSRLNDWRLTTWICWVFYLTFLWIFSWPVLYFSTKRYDVVRAEWAFSKTDAHGNRKFTTVSEEQWVEKFGPAIKQLACERYQGVAGDAMLNEILARPGTHRPVPAELGSTRAVLGAAASVARGGGSHTVSQVSNLLRLAGGSNDDIGWGYSR